ncbi:MAG: protein kinase, partial [Deltaproteobacteria bacterium]|nr:protein kinase [Deltaproteobacteria bacterium]
MDPREAATVPDGEVGADRGTLPPPRLGHFALGDQLGAGGMGVVFRATDTLLDRPVALKVLHPITSRLGAARARLQREAQALARLTHPNVVAVYEIGSAGDELFVAMELVEGTTLREWMRVPHPWREVVAMFIAIGRGVAAVHAIGLVHRDIKPSNVMVDRSGVPKVGDFGLVNLDDDTPFDAAGASAPSALGGDDLTATGSVLGTPAYMAPEQRSGQATARSDQYSFAVALVEALTGALPVPGVLAVPAPLRPIARRALATEPVDRYPTLDAMLAALARAIRPRRWPWIAAGGAALAIAATATALAMAPHDDPVVDPCPAPDLVALWGDARQAALRAHLVAIDPGRGADRMQTATAVIAPMVRAWRDMTVESCAATRVRGAQSDAMLDHRSRCLAQHRAALDASIGELAAAASPGDLDTAITALHRLAPLDACADVAALERASGPALPPEQRAAADAIMARVAQVQADSAAGRQNDLLARAEAIAADAHRLGHPATELAALQVLSDQQLWAGDTEAGTATLRTITQRAAALRDDYSEALAWRRLISLLGADLGRPDDALALVPAAEAALLRAGSPTDLKADLLYSHAQLIDSGPDRAKGVAMLEEAARLLIEAGARDPASPYATRLPDVQLELGMAQSLAGDYERGTATIKAAIAQWQRINGPDSPDEAYGWHNLGALQSEQGRHGDAVASIKHAIAIREARLGPSPVLAQSLTALASVYNDQRAYRDALATYDRALALLRGHVAADDPMQIGAMLGRAMVLAHLGRPDDAQAEYDAAVDVGKASGAETINVALALYNRAELAT